MARSSEAGWHGPRSGLASMGELRSAVRSVLRSGGTSALAVLALGLALGANTSLFTLVDAVLLRALPFADPDRVMIAREGSFEGGALTGGLSGGDAADLPGATRAFTAAAAWRVHGLNAAGSGTPERIPGAVASTTFFRVFPVRVLLGRTFDETLPVGTREAVISERLWRRKFDSDPAVLGKVLSLNGEPVPIVGVVAGTFAVPADAELWLTPRFSVPDHPLRPMEDQSAVRGSNYLEGAVRLAPGVTFAAAQAELDAWSHRRAERFPDQGGPGFRMVLLPYREQLVGDIRPTVLLLWAAAGFTLLLACANVAALLLARAVRKRHEQAVRMALGASRLRLFRSFLLEGLLIAAGGTVLGLLLAMLMPPLLVALWPSQLSPASLRLSPVVLGFSLVLTLGTTLALSVLPALLRPPDPTALKIGVLATTGGRTTLRLREALIAGQVALALLLLASAGLMVRSLQLLAAVSPGFDPRGVVTGSLWLPAVRYPDATRQRDFHRRVLAALRTHPEVAEAAFASRIPFAGGNSDRSLSIPGRPESVDADYRLVTGDYFPVVRIPLLAGRSFREEEESPESRVAIVNQAFVRKFLDGGDALGRAVVMNEDTFIIVGVVGDIHFNALDRAPRPEFYVPLGHEPWPLLNVVVRGPASASVLQSAVRDAVRQVDSEQAFGRLQPLDELVDRSLADRRQAMELLAMVAGLALVLAVTGIYGVLSHAVAARTRELGIRMALGATAVRVLQDVVRQAMLPVLAGLLLGLGAALAVAPVLRRFLFGVHPQDPRTLIAAALGLGLVALATNVLAARRTSRADPAQALQSE
jgi:putative ABC transport system permease protein